LRIQTRRHSWQAARVQHLTYRAPRRHAQTPNQVGRLERTLDVLMSQLFKRQGSVLVFASRERIHRTWIHHPCGSATRRPNAAFLGPVSGQASWHPVSGTQDGGTTVVTDLEGSISDS